MKTLGKGNTVEDFNFADYQAWAKTTAIYPENIKILYPLMGLVGETGEVVEKVLANMKIEASPLELDPQDAVRVSRAHQILQEVASLGKELEVLKKHFRKNGVSVTVVNISTAETKEEVKKEIGDQQWYQAALASDLGLSLQDIAQTNHDKLEDRKSRNVIDSSGDNR